MAPRDNCEHTSGGSRGGAPLFLDQTEAQRAEKKFVYHLDSFVRATLV